MPDHGTRDVISVERATGDLRQEVGVRGDAALQVALDDSTVLPEEANQPIAIWLGKEAQRSPPLTVDFTLA